MKAKFLKKIQSTPFSHCPNFPSYPSAQEVFRFLCYLRRRVLVICPAFSPKPVRKDRGGQASCNMVGTW